VFTAPLHVNVTVLIVAERTMPLVQTAFCAGDDRVAFPGFKITTWGLIFLHPSNVRTANTTKIVFSLPDYFKKT
jgi:hypothetical protein